ncbi:hypothetical protein U1Q18_033856 [Sarracenia purpurea var. burkii]
MRGALSASPPSALPIPPTTQSSRFHAPLWSSSVVIPSGSPEHYRLRSSDFKLSPTTFTAVQPNISFRCNSSVRPGGPGENDSRSVLDAFFLGKALAEALNERIESTVGEFLGALGRLQAEQQKQVQDFQEEVLERANRAKEKAAREAMEAKGLVPKSSATNASSTVNGNTTTTINSATDATPPSLSNSSASTVNTDLSPSDKDSLLGLSNEG